MKSTTRYPRCMNRVSVKRTGKNRYIVTNWDTGLEYPMNAAEVSLLRALDGKTPPAIAAHGMRREEYLRTVKMFRAEGFLRDSNVLSGFGKKRGKKKKEKVRRALHIFRNPHIDAPLLLLFEFLSALAFVPLAVLGVRGAVSSFGSMTWASVIIGEIVGVLICALIYPLSHIFACIACGGRVFEFGLNGKVLPRGIYVLLDTDSLGKVRRFIVDAAAIKWYLLIAGFFLLVSGGRDWAFIVGAVCFVAAMINLVYLGKNDVSRMYSDIFGDNELRENVCKVVRFKEIRNQLRKGGFEGHFSVFISYVLFYSAFVPLALTLYLTYLVIA